MVNGFFMAILRNNENVTQFTLSAPLANNQLLEVTLMFSPTPAPMLQVLRDELRNWNSPEHLCTNVVSCAGTLWYVKTLENGRMARRELLTYLLGKGLVNIAEVRTVNSAEMAQLRQVVELADHATPDNTVLVRLASDYSLDEFPLQDLNIAAAGELVFSVWVRRRDAHLYNRAYVEDVPMFFDHHVALGFNPYLGCNSYSVDIDRFFNANRPGFAGAWRLQRRVNNAPLHTAMLRADATKWDTHYVDCPQRFVEAARQISDVIASRDRDLRGLIRQAGFKGWEAIRVFVFLKRTTKTLRKDVERMLEVVVPCKGRQGVTGIEMDLRRRRCYSG
jgi:hypothetical protein